MTTRDKSVEHEIDNDFDALPQRVRQALTGEEGWGRIVALCAEPGMGKSSLALGAMAYWAQRGLSARSLDLHGKSSAFACEALADLAASVTRQDVVQDRCVVVVDGAPAPDECDVERQATALEGMARAGCLVLLCLRPEAEQLVEELSYVVRIGTDELLRTYPDVAWELVRPLTNGVPALVDALESQEGGPARTLAQALSVPAYASALSSIVSSCVRSSLPVEECRVRLAMLLLGTGTIDDVTAAADRLDGDVWGWLGCEAPVFGIDVLGETFACAGLVDVEGLRCCALALRPACRQMPDVVAQATKVLAARGDLRRAAITCGLCRMEDLASIGCEWGVEFVCAGEDALVARALARHGELGAVETESTEMAALALSALSDPPAHIKATALPPLGSYGSSSLLRRRRRYVELLQACRDMDRGIEPGRVMLPRDDDDDLASALVEHLHARRLLFAGEFSKVLSLLVDNVARQAPGTLVAAMLCDDYEMARVLLGEAMDVDDRRAVTMADEVFAHMGCERLRSYHVALNDLAATLMARASCSFAEVASRAERMGDQALRAAFLLAASVADARKGAYAAAHVHALYVMDMAGGPASDYLVCAARLMDAMVRSHLKDDASLRELAGAARPSPASDMALLMSNEERIDVAPVHLRTLSLSDRPRNELWMLNVILNDFDGDEFSQRFKRHAPKAWGTLSRGAVRRVEKQLRASGRGVCAPAGAGMGRGSSVRQDGSAEMRARRRSPRVKIHVLGGVRVMVDGRDVTSKLGRRRVKPYLLLLAVAKRHELGMLEAIDSLWPGSDLAAGRQRIYSANYEMRRVINDAAGDVDPFARNRGEGTIRLDPAIVSVDIDEFERLAERTLHATGDGELAMRLAGEAASCYVGDIASTSYDAHGLVAQRRDSLRELYVDVAVVGARAALDEGMASQAVRLSKGAYSANDMREDVIAVLIGALMASGREGDACMVYDTYAHQLLSREGRPPAPRIRQLVEDVYRHGGAGQAKALQSVRHEELLLV